MFGSQHATRGNKAHGSFNYDAEPVLDYFSDVVDDSGPERIEDNGTVFQCRVHNQRETFSQHAARK